jgi:hypothetical protein
MITYKTLYLPELNARMFYLQFDGVDVIAINEITLFQRKESIDQQQR